MDVHLLACFNDCANSSVENLYDNAPTRHAPQAVDFKEI